jgi:hypothetical protein
LWIRIDLMRIQTRIKIPMRIRVRYQFQIQSLDDQKLEKIYGWEFFIYFFDQKMQFTYP